MMNDFDITKIEDEVRGILRNLNVSDKVYSNRPKSAESASDFVVVMVSGEVQDRFAYGECMISIDLFAKDNNYIKNGKKLSAMYQKIVKGFPAASERLLFEICPTQLPDAPDDFGYHRRLIRINTLIKAI
jgi:hypothetical protein